MKRLTFIQNNAMPSNIWLIELDPITFQYQKYWGKCKRYKWILMKDGDISCRLNTQEIEGRICEL